MRAICLALVAINILALSAQLFIGAPDSGAESRSPHPANDEHSLIMLAERQGARAPSVARRSAAALDEPPAQPPGQGQKGALCELVGPFDDPERAEHLVQRLMALEIPARREEIDVPAGARYWVHLEPELSQNAALRRLHELQAKNIDSYIIPRGELALGISLGMFSRAELAQQRQADLQALDYDAKVLKISRTQRELWVSLPAPQAAQVADGFWRELLDGQPHLERRQNFCPGVASVSSFH